MHSFSDLATAAYCPRKLYYRRRRGDDHPPPSGVVERRELAFRYPVLRRSDDAIAEAPTAVTPAQLRANLGSAAARLDCWTELANPPARDVFLKGREAHGVAHKVLESPLAPSIVSAGDPPSQGVWPSQAVRAVAAAEALGWERQRPIDRAFVEFPAHGVVRAVALSGRHRARYRSVLRTVDAMDGPPSRLDHPGKCGACEYSAECGVRSRSLRSLLG